MRYHWKDRLDFAVCLIALAAALVAGLMCATALVMVTLDWIARAGAIWIAFGAAIVTVAALILAARYSEALKP